MGRLCRLEVDETYYREFLYMLLWLLIARIALPLCSSIQ